MCLTYTPRAWAGIFLKLSSQFCYTFLVKKHTSLDLLASLIRLTGSAAFLKASSCREMLSFLITTLHLRELTVVRTDIPAKATDNKTRRKEKSEYVWVYYSI